MQIGKHIQLLSLKNFNVLREDYHKNEENNVKNKNENIYFSKCKIITVSCNTVYFHLFVVLSAAEIWHE